MQIGELARRSGLSPSRIRFYEARGLISASRRTNGYRSYSADALLALNIITSAQEAGFSLDEIHRLMPGDASECRDRELVAALRTKADDIKAMERRLAAIRSQIEDLIRDIEDKPEGITPEANVDRILNRVKNGKSVRAA